MNGIVNRMLSFLVRGKHAFSLILMIFVILFNLSILIFRSINKYVLVFIAVLLIEVAACTVAKNVIENDSQWNDYLGTPPERPVSTKVLDDILGFLIMLNYLVPISLYVTIGNTNNQFSNRDQLI